MTHNDDSGFDRRKEETRRRLTSELEERKRVLRRAADEKEAKKKAEWVRLDQATRRKIEHARKVGQERADAAILNEESSLDLSDLPELDELPRFPQCTSLKVLGLSGTAIASLAGLSALRGLVSLDLSRCVRVNDVSPLRELTALRSLNLDETSVDNLSPLTNLNLNSLNIRASRISNLQPIAGMTSLVEGAKRDPQNGGLTFFGNWITDSNLIEIARWNNPGRTERALRYLLGERTRTSLTPEQPPRMAPDLKTPVDVDEKFAPKLSDEHVLLPLPELPDQVPGPRFAMRSDGVVDFAAAETLDLQGNDVRRLHDIQKGLLDTSRDLASELQNVGNEHPQLAKLVREYEQEIDRSLSDINFTNIFGIGLRLQMAAEAAERDITSRLAPALEDSQYGALKSICIQHGVFMIASAEGSRLLREADLYQFRRADLAELRRDAIEFARLISKEPALISKGVSHAIAELSESIDDGTHPERIVNFTYGAIANMLVTLGEISVAIAIGTSIGASGAAGAAAAWVFLRQHASGRKAEQTAKAMHSNLHSETVKGLTTLLERGDRTMTAFLLRNKTFLLRLAESSSRLGFLRYLIDWLERHSEGAGS